MSLVPGDLRRVGLRPDHDEVVVHDLAAVDAEALGEEFLLGGLVVHEHDIGIAAARGVEGLAGAERHDAHVDPGLRLEDRQDVAEQAGLLGRGRRGDDDELVLRHGRQRQQCDSAGQQAQGESTVHEFSSVFHSKSSPRRYAAAFSVFGAVKNASAGVCSSTCPRCMKITSSARRRAWPRSCVVITTLVPAARMAGDDLLDRAGGGRIEARRRLVEEQHFGTQRPGARQRHALLLAAREHARRAVGEGCRGRPCAARRRRAGAAPRAERRRA